MMTIRKYIFIVACYFFVDLSISYDEQQNSISVNF